MQATALGWSNNFPAGIAPAGTSDFDARLDTLLKLKRAIGALAPGRECHFGRMIEQARADDGAGNPSAAARVLELLALELCDD
ncbi:hypothetical protein [Reyranella sp.]|uniref:hypothetical protein n=1 Tax=Reyranella sp. TaxID=1929291 RepID=UPI003D11AD0B